MNNIHAIFNLEQRGPNLGYDGPSEKKPMTMTKAHYELKKVMQHRLAEMQAKNPQYSLRAFAKSLDVNAPSVSEFFNGKRQFSTKLQKRIVEKLNIAPDKKLALMKVIETESEVPVDIERIQVDTDSYHLVADPLYYAILCLIETKDFVEDLDFMSRRLKRSVDEIQECMIRLERVGYIVRKDNKISVGEAHLMTTDDIANMSLRLRHAKNLDNAKEALFNLSVDKRYFRSDTLAIGIKQMPEFKKAATEFFNKLIVLANQSPKDEVYEFCFNFFPLSETNLEQTILKDKIQ